VKPAPTSRRRPAWLPLLTYALLMPLLLWLGFWQLDRRDARIAELAVYERHADQTVAADDVRDAKQDGFRRTTASGRYLAGRQFLIDNIVREGRNGFLVVTPLAGGSDGDILLVNRGWIPQTADRLPVGDIAVATDERTVSGRVGRLPVGGLKLPGSVPEQLRWPSIRQYPDVDELAAALDRPVLPWVLLLDPGEPDGFVRDWEPGGLPPERHLGYAVQWFALAAALTAIAAIMTFRREKSHGED
jgi:surfeit locus 1 family protein